MRDRPFVGAAQRQIAARVQRLLDGVSGDLADDQDDAAQEAAGERGRRAACVVGCAVLLAAVVTGWWVLSSRPRSDPLRTDSRVAVPGAAPVGGSPAAAAASSGPAHPQPSGVIVVDVAGKVHRPGLYRLPSGSRVDDALQAAGGLMPGVNEAAVNRAARISDGQQIVVGQAAAVPVAGGSAGGGSSGGGVAGPININNASLTELQQLPGVGPVLAQHILDWRTEHGAFASIDQLQSVSGIGPAKFAAMRALVAV